MNHALIMAAVLVVVCVAALLRFLRWFYKPPPWKKPVARNFNTQLPKGPVEITLRKLADAQPLKTGIHMLDNGHAAFAARLDLIDQATRSINAQYYMWQEDLTGKLLFSALLAAAQRGVYVRLLLDDNTTSGTDETLKALATHPNVELRLFNPFMLRKPRTPNYLFDFRRINRRMHNKALTVDDCAAVVGGRNVGDEYFNASERVQFADLDVLAVGAVVAEVVREFDDYWNCKSAFAVEDVLSVPDAPRAEETLLALEAFKQGPLAQAFVAASPAPSVVQGLLNKTLELEWVHAKLVVDDPAKGLGSIPRKKLLVAGIEKTLGQVERHIDVATAYFVPGRFGSHYLSEAAKKGKSVRVLTNSLASNDVIPVHAGYARYRKKLLRQGVQLFELRSRAREPRRPTGGKGKLPRFGASNSSLHAKLFSIDDQRVFIGSFNFDPRSLYLNCEMGLLIESVALATVLRNQMNGLIATRSFTPFLDDKGFLSWRGQQNQVIKIEPESTAKQRVAAWLMSWLPVEWLL